MQQGCRFNHVLGGHHLILQVSHITATNAQQIGLGHVVQALVGG